MPADERYDAVHELTRIGTDWHPGCWNKPRTRAPYQVKDGFQLILVGRGKYESVQMWKTIPSVNSIECHSDCQECKGCEHFRK